MKKLIFISFITLIFFSCKEEKNKTNEAKPLSIAQKIANAHGFDNWRNVSEITFTFNEKRSWIWKPKTKDVLL